MITPYVTHVPDGVNDTFPVPFPYLHRSHVKVYHNDVLITVGYTWPTAASIQFTSVPLAGGKVHFERVTPTDPLVTYTPSAALTVEDLQTDALQALYRLEEMEAAVGRAMKVAPDVTGIDTTLPDPEPLHPLVWNAAGDGLANGDPNGTGDLLLRGDLASTMVNKGGDLVGFRQDDVDAQTRTIQDKLRDSISILDFVPTPERAAIRAGTSTYDVTSAVQKALNCAIAQRRALYAPAGKYRLTATVNITGGVTLYGDGNEMQVGDLGSVQTRGKGTWFHIDHTGVGFKLNDPTQYRSGMCITSLGTYRTQPDTTGGTFTPTAHGWDFEVQRCDAHFRDVSLYNPTKGILHWSGGYGRLTINGLRGQPLTDGIDVSETSDTCRIRDVHFWPFFSNSTAVRTHMLNNASAILLRDVDNPDLFGIFTLGYANSVICLPLPATNAMPLKVRLSNFDFDLGGYGFRIATGGAWGVTAMVSHGYIQGSSGATGNKSNIEIAGNDNVVLIDGVGLDLPQDSCIKVVGSNNHVRTGILQISRWNFDSGTSFGIDVAAGNTLRMSSLPHVTQVGTSTEFVGGAGAITCPLLTGAASVTTDASGRANITHNLNVTPRIVNTNSFGSTFRRVQAVSASSTIFTVEVRDSAGALVVSTAGIPVHYQLYY